MVIKKVLSGSIIFCLLTGFNIKDVCGQTTEVITISAKELIERLIRIEENQKSLQRQIDDNQKSMQKQIDDNQKSLQRQIDELRNFILWGFGIMWTGMFALMGFIMWDRRTALLPTIHKVKEIDERQDGMEKVLRGYATKEIKFAHAMRAAGLL